MSGVRGPLLASLDRRQMHQEVTPYEAEQVAVAAVLAQMQAALSSSPDHVCMRAQPAALTDGKASLEEAVAQMDVYGEGP